jgi:disulfide bond formation protein DsbB
MDDLQAALSGDARVVPCDEPAVVFAGLSMAGWNFLLSLALATTVVWALATRRT